MDFDRYATEHPVLIDLIGIASQLIYSDTIKRQVVYEYISNIVKRLDVPYHEIMAEYRNVMQLKMYERETA